MNGIETPTDEGAKRRIPFILNILDAFGIITINRSDFDLCHLPYIDCIFESDSFSATENIAVTKAYFKTGSLPQITQLTELKLKFGAAFLTDQYLLKP